MTERAAEPSQSGGTFLTLGHEAALTAVQRAVVSEHPPHALLLVGPRGVGKTTLALDLAAGLLCLAHDPAARPCRECAACRKVAADNHADLHLVEPQGAGEQIRIAQVQELASELALTAMEGRFRVAVISAAQRLNLDAQNALLKTLEEPGARTHFILLTSQPDALLPTILSRTMRVRFAPLPDDVVARLLEARGVEPERAREVARLAGGSVEVGEHLADPDESEARDRFVTRALEAVAAPGLEPLLALAEDAKKEKDLLRARIAALAATLAAKAADAARADQPTAEPLASRGRLALAALDHLDGNNAPQLVVEAMLSRMRAL
jgi:DNA polymerase-3 subunit delta'